MSVSGVSSASYQPAAAAATERAVLVLKKQQDSAKIQAQALVDLISQTPPGPVGRRINVYA